VSWRRRLLLALLLLVLVGPPLLAYAGFASPAAADEPCNPLLPPPGTPIGQCPPADDPPFVGPPAPPPPCLINPPPPGAAPCTPADPPGPGAPPAPGPPAADPPAAGQPAAADGAVGQLFGEDGTSLSGYDIGYDEGAWDDFSRKFWGGLTQLVWSGVTGLISFCTWLIDWVFDFAIVDYLTDPVTDVASWWNTEIVERLGLPAVLLMLAFAVAGFHLLRGRTAGGIREGFVSATIAAIAAIVLLDPVGYLLGDDGLLGQTEQLSLEVAQITLGEEPVAGDDGASVAEPINTELVDGFVVKPHQVINWGSVLDDQPGCLAVSEEMVATGPHGAEDEPREAMADAGCEAEFTFNETPSSDRLFGAFLVLIAALVMTALIVLVCFSVAAVQVGFAVMACLAVFALPVGILPGPGRAAMWQWVTFAAKLLAALLAAVVFLALMLVLIQGLLSAGNDDSLMGRLAALNALVICGFVFRKRLFAAADRAAVRISGKAAAATGGPPGSRSSSGMLGASSPSSSSSGSRSGSGANTAAALWRENNAEIRRTTAPLRSAGHHAAETGRSAQRVIRPAEDGTTRAQRLHTELSRTRPGRGALHGAKGAQIAGKATKLATAWTLGAPVTLPRAGRVAAAASKAGGQKAKAELNARAEAVRGYGREWGHNAAAPLVAAAHLGGRRPRRGGQAEGTDPRPTPGRPEAGSRPSGPGTPPPSSGGGAGPRPRPSGSRGPAAKTPTPAAAPPGRAGSAPGASPRPAEGPRSSPTWAPTARPGHTGRGPRQSTRPETKASAAGPVPVAQAGPAPRADARPGPPGPGAATGAGPRPPAEPAAARPRQPAASRPTGAPRRASSRSAAGAAGQDSAADRAARLRAQLPPAAAAPAPPARPPMNGPR